MRLLEALASAFFRTFGITQPSAEQQRRAAWFLLGLLVFVPLAIGVAAVLIFRLLRT
jgi:hypothetical protein